LGITVDGGNGGGGGGGGGEYLKELSWKGRGG